MKRPIDDVWPSLKRRRAPDITFIYILDCMHVRRPRCLSTGCSIEAADEGNNCVQRSLKTIENDLDLHWPAVDPARLVGRQCESRFQRDT